MRYFNKTIGLSLATAFAALTLGLSAAQSSAQEVQAQTPAPANATSSALDELLELVRTGRIEENAENARREAEFLRDRNQQQRLIADIKVEIQRAENLSTRLEAEHRRNEQTLATLQDELTTKTGDFGELFGVVRQVSGDTRAQIQQSMISAQYPGRDAFLGELAQAKELPAVEDLEKLWAALFDEMVQQGKVIRFNADVADLSGTVTNRTVVRVGPFTIVSDGQYLQYNVDATTGAGRLSVLGRQPQANAVVNAAEDLQDTTSGMVDAAIDPSRGAILSLLVQQPDLFERFNQGGIVGYFIFALGMAGLALAIFLIVSLTLTAGRVRAQAKDVGSPDESNPLGRVIAAYMNNRGEDTETLELKLDDAILKETPALERGLPIVSVIAAVAPLLGLLGTVTGMIQTFQAITLFGTGDPKLMAGGISQALVTTVLGLTFAIPLLLLHSIAASRSKSVVDTLEQQSAGMVAAHAEGIDHG